MEKDKINDILKEISLKYQSYEVENLGYCRFVVYEKHNVEIAPGEFARIRKVKKMLDENCKEIILKDSYNNISSFTKNLASVCVKKNTKVLDTVTGEKFTQDVKYGIIDIMGVELLSCIYDAVSIKLDGFILLKKDEQQKATNITAITEGYFDWDEAIDWNK
jgi:hypothetical protein